MRTAQLIRSSLIYYWRTNLAVVFGVAIAVAVLTGALLVGDSVRASLRDLFLQRLGKTDQVISATGFFHELLANEIQSHRQFAAEAFAAACPFIELEGSISHEANGARAGAVRVYGIDERFWKFHGRVGTRAPQNREVFLSDNLERELGSQTGDSLLLRIEKPSDIPLESLYGRKEDLGRTLRLTISEVLPVEALGEFSIRPQQSAVRAVFVPLRLLQKELDQQGKINTILISESSATEPRKSPGDATRINALEKILRDTAVLEDYGITLRALEQQRSLSLERSSTLLDDSLAETARTVAASLSLRASPIFSYVANSISLGERAIPYSLVTALDEVAFAEPRGGDGGTGGRGDGKTLGHGDAETRRRGDTGTGGLGDAEIGRATKGTQEKEATVRTREAMRPNVSSSPRPPVSPSPRPSASLSPRLRVPAAGPPVFPSRQPPIILNEWAARELEARQGDSIFLEYYVWHEDGRLETKRAQFQLAAVVPITGLAADRDLVPDYPGISESSTLADWDPPFPVDLSRIRKQDEDYWAKYRTTPKAFIPLAAGQELWQSRFGKLTSLRVTPANAASIEQTLDTYRQKLRSALEPAIMGFTILPARRQGLEAARGATDFGQYFLYFSFFLVISALLLTALFFKLGVEQRLREIGIMQAVGFPASRIRSLFLAEGTLLAIVGSLLGLAGALAYAQLMMFGLRTWWVAAVGTTMLRLHVAPLSLLLGGVGGVGAALACIIWTLKRTGRTSTRNILMGGVSWDRETWEGGDREIDRQVAGPTPRGKDWDQVGLSLLPRVFASPRLLLAIVISLIGMLLLAAASFHLVGQTAGFFGGGTLFLIALLCYQSAWLRGAKTKPIQGTGWWPVLRLGFRNATYRPGRSVLCIALIASAAFIIVAVDTFRRDDRNIPQNRKSGSGGFPLLAESLMPLVPDPNSTEGREILNLAGDERSAVLAGATFTRFRLRPGDDASCLNLYQPRNPRILGATNDFIQSNRFSFQNSLQSTREERENPWLLLNREWQDGVVPVIADANSMTYVLHLKLGDEFVLNRSDAPVRLRIVGTLADSIFQGELLIAEKNFRRLFPHQEGYRFFLIDAPEKDESTIAQALEDRLADFGFDVVPTSERLANFHRVENTYLSTFQMLGGLGLLLGTLGMAAVLLRNVFERRRELALLRAIGYNASHFTQMVVAENALLLCCGLMTGLICALLAIAPVFFARGGRLPNPSLGLLLLAVLLSGLTASLVTTLAALHSPLLPALRAE